MTRKPFHATTLLVAGLGLALGATLGQIAGDTLTRARAYHEIHTCSSPVQHYSGGSGDSVVNGDQHGNARDEIDDPNGRDALFGHDCDDELHGGTDADSLHGNEGADYLFGEEGNERWPNCGQCSWGYAKVSGGKGDDNLYGGPGNDTVEDDEGDADWDDVFGGQDNDWVIAWDGEGDDEFGGGDGDDECDADFGDAHSHGGCEVLTRHN